MILESGMGMAKAGEECGIFRCAGSRDDSGISVFLKQGDVVAFVGAEGMPIASVQR